RTVEILIAGIVGGFGRGIASLAYRPAVELAGAMGGTDIGTDNALQMDLHGPFTEAFAKAVGCLHDQALVLVTDTVAVEDGKTEAFRDQGSLDTIGTAEPDHFERGALAKLDDPGGGTGGACGFGHVIGPFSSPKARAGPVPVFP